MTVIADRLRSPSKISRRFCTVAGIAACLLVVAKHSWASPWAEVGDGQLRSNIELLANAGVIDGITTQWPLPWAGLYEQLTQPGALDGQPEFIRNAAERVGNQAYAQTENDGLHIEEAIDLTNAPDVVRGFDAQGREDAQGHIAAELNLSSTSMRLSLGTQTANRYDGQALVLDNSYLAQRVGNTVIYAGYLTHWWGPGWISALSLSNNARPFPQIGISRIDTRPFDWPVLRWLGPWQAEMFVGVLDGDRIARNTIYDGWRVTLNPFSGFQIGAALTNMMCGTGHPCQPLAEYFKFANHDASANHTLVIAPAKDEGLLDIRYTHKIAGIPFSLYVQEMNEEESNPLPQSVSHLYGGTVWVPIGGDVIRLTLEYANTIPTFQLWGDGESQGYSYNSTLYPDGSRYRDRSLGFSLDSNSQLLSLQAGWTDSSNRAYTLTFHHAAVSDHETGIVNANFYNIVTTSPVLINLVEARVTIPTRRVKIDFTLRAQDDQPRPDHGFLAAAELALTTAF